VTEWTGVPESYVHMRLDFELVTLEFYVRALRFCEAILESDLKAIDQDELLREILGPEQRRSFPIERIARDISRCREWLEKQMQESSIAPYAEVDITHGRVRLIKSAGTLYLAELSRRRDVIAQRPNVSRYVLQAVDQKLAEGREYLNVGVVGRTDPLPLLMDEVLGRAPESALPAREDESLAHRPQPRPLVMQSIEIRDPELRERCLDLFELFREQGQPERLDTVVMEATRILENRLRALSGADATIGGVELAKFALGDKRLMVSHVAPEQEAAHLLYRGVFGFIRNRVHHRLVADLQPERVLQIVGMIDYLISVAAAAAQSGGAAGRNEAE
jgi:hypothetical protein